ncbi:ABC transporter permease [Streptomyces sp. SP17BM10]|uniref:ABC transporter permease n=1 Tax=Streptomyces sp. SP17BM10 TaxID=3002530 RepID=UPI002E773BAD|nr:ABC transporter permease [Streptomyces sp. SP17BM10]MEE1786408.1 ABC transporter permease [Streptomyces sp. SP17BM10]
MAYDTAIPRLEGRRDDPSLAAVVGTELARHKRGFVPWYHVLAPVLITVPLFLGALGSSEAKAGQTFEVFRNVTLEFWGVLVPMTAGLAAALSVRADQDAWRLLLSYGVPRGRYFVGKVAALGVLGFVSSTVLLVMLSIGAVLSGKFPGAMGTVAAAVYLPWLVGLSMTALAVLVAVVWGMGPSIGVGVAGLLCGALVSDKVFWYAVPFAWPMRVVLPLAGIGPNGVPLPKGSPVTSMSAIPLAVVLGGVLTAVLLLVGSLHMRRKEI